MDTQWGLSPARSRARGRWPGNGLIGQVGIPFIAGQVADHVVTGLSDQVFRVPKPDTGSFVKATGECKAAVRADGDGFNVGIVVQPGGLLPRRYLNDTGGFVVAGDDIFAVRAEGSDLYDAVMFDLENLFACQWIPDNRQAVAARQRGFSIRTEANGVDKGVMQVTGDLPYSIKSFYSGWEKNK